MMITTVRQRAQSLPDGEEVRHLAEQAAESPSTLTAGQIRKIGDIAVRQAELAADLLQRLTQLAREELGDGRNGKP